MQKVGAFPHHLLTPGGQTENLGLGIGFLMGEEDDGPADYLNRMHINDKQVLGVCEIHVMFSLPSLDPVNSEGTD
jgi:hypothetical protein